MLNSSSSCGSPGESTNELTSEAVGAGSGACEMNHAGVRDAFHGQVCVWKEHRGKAGGRWHRFWWVVPGDLRNVSLDFA
jgi:hypothetical protein